MPDPSTLYIAAAVDNSKILECHLKEQYDTCLLYLGLVLQEILGTE